MVEQSLSQATFLNITHQRNFHVKFRTMIKLNFKLWSSWLC